MTRIGPYPADGVPLARGGFPLGPAMKEHPWLVVVFAAAFLLLGLALAARSHHFTPDGNPSWVARVGGAILALFGLAGIVGFFVLR